MDDDQKGGRRSEDQTIHAARRTAFKARYRFQKKDLQKIIDELGGNLQYVICGGAFLDQDIIDDFHAWGITVLNGYGITECSPVVAVNRNHFIKKVVSDRCSRT